MVDITKEMCYIVAKEVVILNGMTIRGLAISKFMSMAKFAKHIGWSERRTRDILSGRQEPTAKDIEELATALEIETAEEFIKFFYPRMPQCGINT